MIYWPGESDAVGANNEATTLFAKENNIVLSWDTNLHAAE